MMDGERSVVVPPHAELDRWHAAWKCPVRSTASGPTQRMPRRVREIFACGRSTDAPAHQGGVGARAIRNDPSVPRWQWASWTFADYAHAAYAYAAYAAYAAAYADCAADAAEHAADAAGFVADAAGFVARKENKKQTADICRKYLPIEIWNIYSK